MKTLSGTFRFIVLGVIVLVAIVGCCIVPVIRDTTSVITGTGSSVELGHQLRAKIPKRTYVDWKNQGDFDKALKQVCDHHGTYCIYVKMDDAGPDPIHPYQPSNPPSNCSDCRPGNIRTVKVTKSKAAENIATGESIANDPNVSHRVQSPDPGDIIKVLDALKK